MVRILFLLLLLPTYVQAENIFWDWPTEREDNTPLMPSEISHVIVMDNDVQIGIHNYEVPQPFIYEFGAGLHTVNLLTVDTDGLQSAKSINLVFGNFAPPKPPSGVHMTR